MVPDGGWAVHTWSTFGSPPRPEFVTLSDHVVVRTLATNDGLRAMVGKLSQSPVEYFGANIGGGVELDRWLMKPVGRAKQTLHRDGVPEPEPLGE